ncbi:hypothetical protein LF845_09310 [Deferribacterales bacterium Es71-Z0220]|uniref:hypothetical protein n=1 Tax=Deferrivibrio essentukiensis TaxID=2880922 RepID=UPI001F620E71|nr:hypothetical protein [Deferrivibrio essentukiensis]MCB4205155.1 hypothetical protein [Deferrivibrio essentukiensis]
MTKALIFNDIFINNNKLAKTLSPYFKFEIYERHDDINSFSCLIGIGSGCFQLLEKAEKNKFKKDIFLISCYLDFDRFLHWTLKANNKEISQKIGIDDETINKEYSLSELAGKKYFLNKNKFECKFHLIYSLDNKMFDTNDALKIVDLIDYPRLHIFEEGGFAPILKFPEYISNLILGECKE